MIARGLLIGVALVAMGLLHVFGNSDWTAVIGAAVLAVTGVGWLVKSRRTTGGESR